MVEKRARGRRSSNATSAASMSSGEDDKMRASYTRRSDGRSPHHDEEDDELMHTKDRSGHLASGLKRQRVHFSCTECHRRKQKCNRETPCQHCIARKIPERCKTFQPGEDPNDLGSRVARLERAVADNFDKLFGMLHDRHDATDLGKDAEAGPSRRYEHVDAARSRGKGTVPLAAKFVAGAALASGASMSKAPSIQGEVSEEDDIIVPLAKSEEVERSDRPISMRVNELIKDSMDNASHAPNPNVLAFSYNRTVESATPLDVVMVEYGAPFGVSQMLLAAIPPRDQVDTLLAHFFEHINWLRMPLSRKRFYARLDLFFKSGPTLSADFLNAYAMLMFVLAISTTTCPTESGHDLRALRLTARRLFFAGRQAIMYSVMFGREDIEQVLALHTAARYLFLDRRISEAWTCVSNAVKAAHSIGLHRDASHFKLSSVDCEARRRVWSYVYSSDRMLGMNLGRPTAVDDDVVDTQLPAVEDETDEFEKDSQLIPGATVPEGEKPQLLFITRVRHQCATIMGRVMSTYQNLRHPAHYSDVVSIDHDLMSLHASLPSYLRSEFSPEGTIKHVETKWDKVYKFVSIHRYLIQSEIFFIRMSLHRPYLLRADQKSAMGRRGSSHATRYAYSRRACIEAAHYTLVLRRQLRIADRPYSWGGDAEAPPPLLNAHLGTYNVLHAIVFIGIALLQDPHAEFADQRLAILKQYDDFWQSRKVAARHIFDEVKERDMVILQIFLERIEAARQGKRTQGESKEDPAADVKTKRRGEGSTSSTAATNDHDTARDRLTKSPAQVAPMSTEEDTAGVLLNLNQGTANSKHGNTTARKGGAGADSASKVEPLSKHDHFKNDEMPMPWPYLPTRMPHHQGSVNGSKPSTLNGVGGSGNSEVPNDFSPLGTHSSTDDTTPPANSRSSKSGRGNSGQSDDLSGAGVHQLFDSWFRYNAFDTLEFDGLNTSTGGVEGAAPPVGSQNATESMEATLNGGNIQVGEPSNSSNSVNVTTSNPWMAAPLLGASANDMSQSLRSHTSSGEGQQRVLSGQSGVFSGVPQWSSMPPSGWPLGSTETSGSQGIVQPPVSSAAANAFGVGSFENMAGYSGAGSLVGPASTFDVRGQGNAVVDAASATDTPHPVMDASYDPIFWQSLIDKISG